MAQAAVVSQQSPILIFRDRLLARRGELAHALQGSGVTVDRFVRAATTAVQITPSLADCSFQSLWIALLKACRDQLLPDGVQGAIVPYKREATWIPMYRGLISRFERSGHYRWITADFHRDDDLQWRNWIDEGGAHFIHEPGPRRGAILETYACATTQAGAFFISVVTNEEMDRIRAMSKASRDDAPWKIWPDEMAKKTALRRLAKILPMPPLLGDFVDERGNDDDENQAPAPTRAPGVTAALDEIVRREAATGDSDPTTGPPDEPEIDVPEVYKRTAFERGKADAQDGIPATELPEEYRHPKRTVEAKAWREGHTQGASGSGPLGKTPNATS